MIPTFFLPQAGQPEPRTQEAKSADSIHSDVQYDYDFLKKIRKNFFVIIHH